MTGPDSPAAAAAPAVAGSLWLSLSVSNLSIGRGNQPQTRQARDTRSPCKGSFWEPLPLGRGNSSHGAQFTALKDADEGTHVALGPLQRRSSLMGFLGKAAAVASLRDMPKGTLLSPAFVPGRPEVPGDI